MQLGEFVQVFGSIYEHTPLAAERAFMDAPFRDLNHLTTNMANVVAQFNGEQQRELILKHPRLGKREELTTSSQDEQASAGLDNLDCKKALDLAQLNDDYFDRFAFPFIVAVKLLQGRNVLDVINERLNNEVDTEFSTALREIDKIAKIRLAALFKDSQG